MKEKILNLIEEIFVKPASKNVPLSLCIAGVVCVLVGAIFGSKIDALAFIPDGSGRTISNVGSAILGAGVFAAIMKSVLFIDVFQKHIFDVLYTPNLVMNLEKLKEKWVMITEAILENTLPRSHRDAANSVLNQFFDKELQYHFENLENTYDIDVHPDNVTATVKYTTVTDLLISPNHENPIVTQKMKVKGQGKCDLLFLSIDNTPIDANEFLDTDPNDPDTTVFTLPLKEFLGNKNTNGDRVIKLERTYQYSQNLSEEPYIVATFSRYVRTCVVKAKINKRRVIFEKSGIDNFLDIKGITDVQGYNRWSVAEKNQLLLPGQGYVLIIF